MLLSNTFFYTNNPSEVPKVLKDFFELLNWLENMGVFYVFLFLGLVFLILKPEWAKRISLLFVTLFTLFKWARKTKISRSFELNISTVSKEINKEIGNEILPSNPKIKWVKNTTRESFINDDKVVVKLDYHEDRNRSFALATSSYVNKGLLPIARQYIPEDIMETCSLLVTRKIIHDKNKESLDFFVTEILEEVFSDKPEIEHLYNELTDLDNNAMFLQILMPELWKMGRRIYPNNVNKESIKGAVENLIKFLHRIATKNYDENAPLNLDSNLFKLRVILVGRMETLSKQGIEPYKRRVSEGIHKDYNSIYLLGYEKKSNFLKKIEDIYKDNENIESIKIREGNVLNRNFDNMKSICIALSIKENINNNSDEEAS